MGIPLAVREAPKAEAGREPYRTLFPIGVAIGAVGVGLWIARAFGWVAYPGRAHAALLLLGFQHAFVLGFLMTAMPAFRKPAARDRGGATAARGPVAGPTPPADLLVVFAGAQFRKEFAVRAWRAGAARAVAIAVARFEWRRAPRLGLPADGGLGALVEATPPRKRLFVIVAEGGGADARVAKKGPWGTWSEAKAFARIVRERGASSVLVCTSGYHVARARAALRRALEAEGCASGVALLPYPAPEPETSHMAPGRRGRSPRAWVSLLRERFKRTVYAIGLPMTFDPVSPPATPRDRGPSTRPSRRDP